MKKIGTIFDPFCMTMFMYPICILLCYAGPMFKRFFTLMLALFPGLHAADLYTVQEVVRGGADFRAIAPWNSGLNNRGQVLGHAYKPGGAYVSFLWDADQGLQQLKELIPGLEKAMAINDQGVILGLAYDPRQERPFIWDGKVQWIGGSEWFGTVLNNRNQVLMHNGRGSEHAIWDSGKLTRIEMDRSLYPFTINDQAQVLCWDGTSAFSVWHEGKRVREVRASEGYWPASFALNNQGDVVGQWQFIADLYDREEVPPIATIWHHKGHEIQISAQDQTLEVTDINDQLQVVGYDRTTENHHRAFLWTPEDGLIYLQDHISPGDFLLEVALAINNHGQILALAQGDLLLLLSPLE
jgi:probable HAF family extracellular repeat protein